MQGSTHALAPLVPTYLPTTRSSMMMSDAGAEKKSRKPYTLSKSRERWSQDEHARFLEALRQHGRQWRLIERAVQTKTSVQIRSHAQKFFIKLEKQKKLMEAGLPLAFGTHEVPLDIDVPPPRKKLVGSMMTHTAPTVMTPSEQHQHQHQHLHQPQPHDMDITVAAVASAAAAAAAAAASAVLRAAGQEIEQKLASDPPATFPFFGMSPELLRGMCNPQQFQANIHATLANYDSVVRTSGGSGSQEGGQCRLVNGSNGTTNGTNGANGAGNNGNLGSKKNIASKKTGAEKTGTSEPGVVDFAANSYHGEDGDRSACSREEDNEENDMSDDKVDLIDTEMNGSEQLAKFLNNPNPVLQVPSTTGWASQYSDPNGVSNMWHSLGGNGGGTANANALAPGVAKVLDERERERLQVNVKAEEKNASGEGGSSGNDSVHPTAGNGKGVGGNGNGNGNGNGTVCTNGTGTANGTANNGKSGEGSNDKIGSNDKNLSNEKTANGSNDKKGSGEGSNDKNTSIGMSQNPAQLAPPPTASSAQQHLQPPKAHMQHAFQAAMNALQTAGFGDLVVPPGRPPVGAMKLAAKNVVYNNPDSATAIQLTRLGRAAGGPAQGRHARKRAAGDKEDKDDKDYKPPASVRAMSGSDVSHRSNRSRGMKRSSGSSDENGPEVKKGGRNRKSKPVKSNVS